MPAFAPSGKPNGPITANNQPNERVIPSERSVGLRVEGSALSFDVRQGTFSRAKKHYDSARL